MSESRRTGRRPRAREAAEPRRTPYEILGVPESASAEEIRSAYLTKVKEFPPEREPDGFKRVQKAYGILRDAARRKLLDRSVFRKQLEPDPSVDVVVDCGALFLGRVFQLLLVSSDLYVEDFSRLQLHVDPEIERLS